MPINAIKQCPKCGRKKTGRPGASYFDIYRCAKCATRYCDAATCGAHGCPKCGAHQREWAAKVRSAALFEFATKGDFDARIQDLQDMAQKHGEEWSFGNVIGDPWVLRSYVLNTFARLQQEEKVQERRASAAFNTGLVTDFREDIYGLFSASKRRAGDQPPWHFQGFYRSSDHDVREFRGMDITSYFTDPSVLVFDPSIEFTTDLRHIVRDNKSRFPLEVRDQPDHFVLNHLNGAIEHAKARVRRNYKTAIPQWYNQRMQLLLPLCFVSEARTDLAICVRRDVDQGGKASYVAKTALTLPMAYCNARLITKPDREWLNPSADDEGGVDHEDQPTESQVDQMIQPVARPETGVSDADSVGGIAE